MYKIGEWDDRKTKLMISIREFSELNSTGIAPTIYFIDTRVCVVAIARVFLFEEHSTAGEWIVSGGSGDTILFHI